jgi:hypothetical protein
MTTNRYRYYVTYTFQTRAGVPGHGFCEIHRDQPITGADDIDAITARISAPGTELYRVGARNLLVLSFSRFDDPAVTR